MHTIYVRGEVWHVVLLLVSRDPLRITHDLEIGSAERKAGETKVCVLFFFCCLCLVIVSALTFLSQSSLLPGTEDECLSGKVLIVVDDVILRSDDSLE